MRVRDADGRYSVGVIAREVNMPSSCFDCPFEGDGLCLIKAKKVKSLGIHSIQRTEWCPLEKSSEWIPVSEKLPDKDGNYLVVTLNGDQKKPEVHEAAFWMYMGDPQWREPVEEYGKYEVTHWMELPKPPEVKNG